MEKEIRISNNLNEIVVLASFIEELGEELSLPAETVNDNQFGTGEAVANINCTLTLPRATYYLTESYFNRKTTDFPSHR